MLVSSAKFRKSNFRKKNSKAINDHGNNRHQALSVAEARVDSGDLDLTPSDCNIGLHLSCLGSARDLSNDIKYPRGSV